MFTSLLKKFLRHMAIKRGRFKGLYRKICRPTSEEYAVFLKAHGKLHAVGEGCRFNPYVNIPDPEYVSIGNHVTLSHCNLIGHDGVIGVLNDCLLYTSIALLCNSAKSNDNQTKP